MSGAWARRQAKTGSAIVELALALPLLCLLLLGVFDLGRIYAEQVAATAAAREGARAAMHLTDDAVVRRAVINELNGIIALDREGDIAIQRDVTDTQTVVVTVHYRHTLLFGLFSDLSTDSRIALAASATMPLAP